MDKRTKEYRDSLEARCAALEARLEAQGKAAPVETPEQRIARLEAENAALRSGKTESKPVKVLEGLESIMRAGRIKVKVFIDDTEQSAAPLYFTGLYGNRCKFAPISLTARGESITFNQYGGLWGNKESK